MFKPNAMVGMRMCPGFVGGVFRPAATVAVVVVAVIALGDVG